MDPVKKVVKKKNVEVSTVQASTKGSKVSEFNSYIDPTLTLLKVKKLLSETFDTNYDIQVTSDKWVLPNRKKFGNWIDKTFKYGATKASVKQSCECEASNNEEQSCTAKVSTMSLFPHQNFIKDYIQFDSPYRGLLVYHGLGSGKSCASIAAAEMLINHMNAIVMVPSSLHDNYIAEIKKCGRKFFQPVQHWTFVPLSVIKSDLNDVMKMTKVSEKVMQKNKGLWICNPVKTPNFGSLPPKVQRSIQDQLDDMVENRFEFIHYNGLHRTHIDQLTKGNTINPFDNKCIIVDEVHNLISRIANGKLIAGAIYKLLMKAKNLKLILLSGTPIINYPHEIAYIINLITGTRIVYELKASKDGFMKKEEIETVLNNNNHVDYFTLSSNGKILSISLLPNGFIMKDRKHAFVKRTPELVYDSDIIKGIQVDLQKKGVKVQSEVVTLTTNTLPEKVEDFGKYFINSTTGDIKNELMFQRRILGTVSFYSTYSEELYPSVSITEVPLEMNDDQFSIYEKLRMDERKKERAGKNGKYANKESGGQVYRFYSRAVCNFAFPKKVERPFPSKISHMTKEIDDFDETLKETTMVKADEDKEPVSNDYESLVNTALKKLEEGTYLLPENLEHFSPKFHAIIKNIEDSPGSSLIYSQFRKVEGLGILAKALHKRGFVEFKIKKHGDTWDVDMDQSDYSKPKYIMFTGSDEANRVLLSIFNSDIEQIPPKIKEKLPQLGGNNNFKGNIIKVFMITQSGAEGISLKNVRQVHIVEPYWNHIRIDQVVGRAVRTCSHIDLPAKDRHVHVYIYYMKFTDRQKKTITIERLDKQKTSDEYIFNIAKTKKKIMDGFLGLMKKASVDCAMNAKYHNQLRCFNFPANMEDDNIVIRNKVEDELLDANFISMLGKHQWNGHVMITNKGTFLVRIDTGEVYDYDIYMESGKLVKIGILHVDGKTKVIKKDI